jgi:hypothetical protein
VFRRSPLPAHLGCKVRCGHTEVLTSDRNGVPRMAVLQSGDGRQDIMRGVVAEVLQISRSSDAASGRSPPDAPSIRRLGSVQLAATSPDNWPRTPRRQPGKQQDRRRPAAGAQRLRSSATGHEIGFVLPVPSILPVVPACQHSLPVPRSSLAARLAQGGDVPATTAVDGMTPRLGNGPRSAGIPIKRT